MSTGHTDSAYAIGLESTQRVEILRAGEPAVTILGSTREQTKRDAERLVEELNRG